MGIKDSLVRQMARQVAPRAHDLAPGLTTTFVRE